MTAVMPVVMPSWRAQRLVGCIGTILLLMLCAVAAPSVRAACPAPDNDRPALRYSLDDVAAGRLADAAALDRMRLQVGDERIDVAIVTDAARDELDDSWPVFPPQSRLMLVALDTGRPIWELVQAPNAAADGSQASDPRLTAALGAAAILRRADGLAQRLYVGDSAARVWRIDLPLLSTSRDARPGDSVPQPAVSAMPLALLADLARGDAAAAVRFRKAPDLVRSIDSKGTPFDGVLITSEGAMPGSSDDSGNGLFFLRDYAVLTRAPGEALPRVITWQDLLSSQASAVSGAGAGWFARFQNAAEVGSKRPVTVDGRVFLITALAAPACGDPPLVLAYVFNLLNGRPVAKTLPGSIAGLGPLSGPTTADGEIGLPGLGIALPVRSDEEGRRFRARFMADGVFARIAYWRDLLLDVD